MKSSLRNMIMVLLLISLVSSAAVGWVYQLTKDTIEQAKQTRINDAVTKVLPPFTDLLPATELEVEGVKVNFYSAKSGSDIAGYAVESFSKEGFGGMIKIIVGFTPEGVINRVAVVSHSETPGLGDKIDPAKSNFSQQFEKKDPQSYRLSVKKDGGDVDAITASTITSRAFVDAVKRAVEIVNQNK